MTSGQFFLGPVAIFVATFVYRWQKSIDNANQRRSERRVIYRKYAAAVEAFMASYPSAGVNQAYEKISELKQVEGELLVSLPPNILPRRLVTSRLALDVVMCNLKLKQANLRSDADFLSADAELKTLDELKLDLVQATERFLNYYDAVIQSMRLDSLVNVEVTSPFLTDMQKIEEFLNTGAKAVEKQPEA